MKQIAALLLLMAYVLLTVSCANESISTEPAYDVGPSDWSDFSANSIEQLIADLSLAKSEGPEKLSEENKGLYELHELSTLEQLIYPTVLHVENFKLIGADANLYAVSYYYMPEGSNNGKITIFKSWEGIQLKVFREYYDDMNAQMALLAEEYKGELRENGTVYANYTSTDLLVVPYRNTYCSIYAPTGMFTPEEMLELFELDVYDLSQ